MIIFLKIFVSFFIQNLWFVVVVVASSFLLRSQQYNNPISIHTHTRKKKTHLFFVPCFPLVNDRNSRKIKVWWKCIDVFSNESECMNKIVYFFLFLCCLQRIIKKFGQICLPSSSVLSYTYRDDKISDPPEGCRFTHTFYNSTHDVDFMNRFDIMNFRRGCLLANLFCFFFLVDIFLFRRC